MKNTEITKIGILYFMLANNKNDIFVPTSKENYNEVLKYSNKIQTDYNKDVSYNNYIIKEKMAFDKAKEAELTLNNVNYSINTDKNITYTINTIEDIESDIDFKGWVTDENIISYIKYLNKSL